MIESYETRKLHISVPLNLYEFIRTEKLFKNIDGIVVRLLMKEFDIED